jgi:Uma2 family endonuclease
VTATQPITVEQFVALPDEVTDHHELVEGDLIPVPSSTLKNSLIRDRLLFFLNTWSSSHHLVTAVSEMDVRTGSKTVRRPDISIFSAEQISRFAVDAVPVPEPPMIAIEVLSPSEGMIAVGRKVAGYLSTGSQEVWLIDHENREVHVRTADEERLLRDGKTLESGLLPGFHVSVGELLSV